jgi:hypothetical protein
MNAPAEKPFVVVSVLDPAIDTESMPIEDMIKYYESRDTALLKFKPGRQPQRYHLREVKQSVWESWVMASELESVRHLRAFMCSVIRVDNILQRDGSILSAPWEPSNREAASMLDGDVERFSASDRAEIGAVAFARSFLAPRTVKTYPLPPTLRPSLAAREFLRADATPPSPAPSSGEASSSAAAAATPPPASTAGTRSSSASATVDPTAATAPAPAMEAASSP